MIEQKNARMGLFGWIVYIALILMSGAGLFYFSDKDLGIDTALHDQNAVNTFVHFHWYLVTISSIVVAAFAYFYAVWQKKEVLRRALLCLFVMMIGYQLFWCAGIKVMWGRVRFIHLDEVNTYSPFYEPQWFSGHHSFPSGHTSSIVVWLAPCWALIQSKKRVLGTVLLILVLCCVGLMAYSRVCYGAHYPTDTLFALFSGCIFLPLAWFVTCWFEDKVQPKLQAWVDAKKSKKTTDNA